MGDDLKAIIQAAVMLAVDQLSTGVGNTTARPILSGGGRLQSPVDAYVRTACVIRPFVPAV